MRRDIPAVLAAVDVFVLSTHWEGLPVALLEAMAAARPVVASSVAGVPGVVDDGVTGLIVAHADPSALAEACAQLLRDPDRAKRMGAAGRQRVAAHFSAEQMLAGIQKGDEVITSGGTLGKVTSVGDNYVKVEIAPAVEVTVQKSAVQTLLPKGTLKNAT
jgi:preprotein translocase YajC subunit